MYNFKKAIISGLILSALLIVPFGISQMKANEVRVQKTARFSFGVGYGRPYWGGGYWGGYGYRPYYRGYYNYPYRYYYSPYWYYRW